MRVDCRLRPEYPPGCGLCARVRRESARAPGRMNGRRGACEAPAERAKAEYSAAIPRFGRLKACCSQVGQRPVMHRVKAHRLFAAPLQ